MCSSLEPIIATVIAVTKRKYELPDSKSCDWCGNQFKPLSFRHRCCSDGCCSAIQNHKVGRHACGPCPTCGTSFLSRTKNKIYCCFDCYIQSDQFAATKAKNLLAINPQGPRVCAGCGAEYSRSRKAKYCSSLCRRKYFAERFDRWIANPEAVALPQNFDEFLARTVLTCPVSGCEWEGEFLGAHVNFAHGITAREFKKLCGFNVTTGLVGQELSARFSRNTQLLIKEGIIIGGAPPGFGYLKRDPHVSLEAKEHARKGIADRPALKDVFLLCRECGINVQQPTCGQKLYCSIPCRSRYYAKQNLLEAACAYCGAKFTGSRDQSLRHKRGLPVCCSQNCRNRLNIVHALAARGIGATEPLESI